MLGVAGPRAQLDLGRGGPRPPPPGEQSLADSACLRFDLDPPGSAARGQGPILNWEGSG